MVKDFGHVGYTVKLTTLSEMGIKVTELALGSTWWKWVVESSGVGAGVAYDWAKVHCGGGAVVPWFENRNLG